MIIISWLKHYKLVSTSVTLILCLLHTAARKIPCRNAIWSVIAHPKAFIIFFNFLMKSELFGLILKTICGFFLNLYVTKSCQSLFFSSSFNCSEMLASSWTCSPCSWNFLVVILYPQKTVPMTRPVSLMHIFSFQMSYHFSIFFWLSSVPILSFLRENKATCNGWENRGLKSDKFGLKSSPHHF